MSHITKSHRRLPKQGTRIKDLEKELGVDFKVPGDTTVSEYLRKEGLPALAELLEMSEQAAA